MNIPFGYKSDKARSGEVSEERAVNCYLEIRTTADGKSNAVMYGSHGLDELADAGTVESGRGIYEMGGLLYAVIGASLYSITSAGVATSRGLVVAGVNPVSFAELNGKLIIVTNPEGYVYNPVTATLTQITDPDFVALGATSVTALDGYAIFSAADDSGKFFISTLLDPTTYAALDFATAEARPDPLLAVYSDHRDLLLFGTKTLEIWFNSGASFPFERKAGGVIERGCHHKGSIASDDNSVFWVGNDLIVYRLEGVTPIRISSFAVEQSISENLTQVFESFTYTDKGHKFYVLTFGLKTWIYDISTQFWHERESYEHGRWRVRGYTWCYSRHIFGDYSNALIYAANDATYTENGERMDRVVQSPPVHAYPKRMKIGALTVDFEGGVGLNTGQGSDPQAMLSWSDDGGKTWSTERWASIGKIGEYRKRAKWSRLGQFQERTFRLRVSDPVQFALLAADAVVIEGR